MKRYLTAFIIFLISSFYFSNSFAQSPYELNFKKETYLLGFGVSASAAGWYSTTRITPLSEKEINYLSKHDINKFDRFVTAYWSPQNARMSNVLLGSFLVLPASFYFSGHTRDDIATISVIYAEVALISFGLTQLTKGLAQRVRPFVYNSDSGIAFSKKNHKDAKQSFFSGHTSVAFASAVFTSTVFSAYFPGSKWKYPVWCTSLGSAALTGFLRVRAGKHFPTDVLVGAAVGGLTGYFIPYLHRKNSSNNVNIIPCYQQNQFQITFNFSF